MSEAAVSDELTKCERRTLLKLFGGGSLRYDPPQVVDAFRTRGFVDENDKLAMPGLLVLTLAIRRQQAEARWRMGLAA